MQKNELLVIFIIKFFIVTLFKNSGNSVELVIILNFGALTHNALFELKS